MAIGITKMSTADMKSVNKVPLPPLPLPNPNTSASPMPRSGPLGLGARPKEERLMFHLQIEQRRWRQIGSRKRRRGPMEEGRGRMSIIRCRKRPALSENTKQYQKL